jgi:L-threonylcarbamoyladenylate synthase
VSGHPRPRPPARGVLDVEDARRLQECVQRGGVAVFPADTVYGVCCDPESEHAVRRLYALKGRASTRPSAIMFFALQSALACLAEQLTELERTALLALLPGPVTLLLPDRGGRFAAARPAGASGQAAALGLRVPLLAAPIQALGSVSQPVMQSSANISGGPDARRLRDVPRRLLDGAELVLDGGELPGTPSTVIDLRDYDASRAWAVRREGALPAAEVGRLLATVGADAG